MLYKMGLQEKYFNAVKDGRKQIEMRLFDEKRSQIVIGDTIRFLKEPDRIEKIDTIVIALNQYNSFQEAIEKLPIEKMASSKEEEVNYINDLELYYPKDKQDQYGVLAITVELPQRLEKSCGIVVFKKENNQIEVLLVHHNKGHWGLPKGHVEEGETEEETAIREVKEETNIDAKILNDFRKVITYSPKEHILKDVVFFIGEANTNNSLNPQMSEVEEVSWFNIDTAMSTVTHKDEQELLKETIKYYCNNLW